MLTTVSGPRAAHDIIGNVGNTPLLRVAKIAAHLPGIEIYAKAEYFNPGGSVKDRAALSMILAAERAGQLTPGKTLIDSTSGNTGIAYAMICAARGYKVKLCLPMNASIERKRILKAYGAELVLMPGDEGSDGAIRKVKELYATDPDSYFYADQYSNENNWKAHYNTTAPEIIAQTEGRVTHFVALMGTSGTFTGTSRRLKEELPGVQCMSAQPSTGFHGIEGAKHLPSAIMPSIYDSSLADQNLEIATEDAHAMARCLARDQGLLVGVSAAAAIVGSLQVAERLKKDQRATIVTILCDSGEKYLSERFWHEE